MKIVKKLVGFLIALTLILGWKFYNKSITAKEIKQSLLAICAEDADCSNAVNNHFQDCFNSSYNLGSRRRSASLDGKNLTTCINNNSGAEYFSYQ